MKRKRVMLSGLVVLLALSAGCALSQTPSTPPAQAPGYVDPMLQPPPRVQTPDTTQAPTAAPPPASAPPAAMPPPVKASKKKGKQAAQKSAPLPKPQDLPGASAPTVVAPVPTPASPGAATDVSNPADAAVPTPVATEAGQGASKKPVQAKKGKPTYTGPKDIIELPPTPMLDQEGRQRLDASGAPMSNPAVKQQRDKKGHPLFDDQGKPVFQTATDQGYDDKGKKIKAKKEKAAKTVPVNITKGTLTVDGLIGKAALNYEIKEFKFVYLYAPWIGTVIVSNRTFPGAKEQAKAFDQHTLTVTVEDHQFQVYSEKLILGKKPEAAFVAVDRDFKLDTKYPAMGYGKLLQAPYGWPGAKASPESKAYVKPPPLPPDLRPIALLPACPEGQVRPPTPPAKSGAQPAPLPCVAVEGAKLTDAPAVEGIAPAAEAPAALAAPAPPPVPPPLS